MAKKRHHHSMKNMEEHMRRRHEMMDAGMIQEDRSAIANLPQNVKIAPYPKVDEYMPEVLDDTIRGIDMQMRDDNRQRKRGFNPTNV
jgi:hypothetical protein